VSTIAQRRRLTTHGLKLQTMHSELGYQAEVTDEHGQVVGIAIRDFKKEAETDAIDEALKNE